MLLNENKLCIRDRWNPPLLYLEYHFFIFQSENIRYGLEYHLSISDIQTPIQGFILLAGLSPTLISKRPVSYTHL